MRRLYNEGRVLGMSAYEMYVRNAKQLDPNRSPASEKEWLASTLADGSSMLLRVGVTAQEGYNVQSVFLPTGTRLAAANTIFASPFIGDAYANVSSDESWGWATRVTDYGCLAANNADYHPSDTGIPPTRQPIQLSSDEIDSLKEYAKIIDGVVLQDGTWEENSNKPPYMDFTPDLSATPRIRLLLNGAIKKPFYVLLTGFTNKVVDAGESGFQSPVNSPSPQDGDFLGPWQFPWAAKIIFSVSNAMIPYLMEADEVVEDLQSLQIYNTPYTYLFRSHDDATYPTTEDLQDVHHYVLNQKIYGYLSDTFVSDYCLSANEVATLFDTGGTATWFHDGIFFLNMFNQLEKNGTSWIHGTNAIDSPYKYFLMAGGQTYSAPGQQYYLVPIDSRTGMIAVNIPTVKNNIMSSSATYLSLDMTDKLDYLGSWYNGTLNQTDSNLATWGSLEDHPTHKAAIPDVTAFYQPYALTPKPAYSAYEYDYYTWLKTTKAYGNMISAEDWVANNIHNSYRNLSCIEFIMKAATHYLAYDISSPTSIQDNSDSLEFKRYIISKQDLMTTVNAGLDSEDNFVEALNADVSIKATLDPDNYFSPADLAFISISDSSDVTDNYRSTSHNAWCSVGTVNKHVTKSISLIDDNGSPLSLQGTSEKQSANDLVWVDLLDALNHNKRIDVLGDNMKALKSALESAEANKTYGFKKNSDGTFSLVEVGT